MSRTRVKETVENLDEAMRQLELACESGDPFEADPVKAEAMIRHGCKVIEIRAKLTLDRVCCDTFDQEMRAGGSKAWMLLPAVYAGAIHDWRKFLQDHGVETHDLWYLKFRFWAVLARLKADRQLATPTTANAGSREPDLAEVAA